MLTADDLDTPDGLQKLLDLAMSLDNCEEGRVWLRAKIAEGATLRQAFDEVAQAPEGPSWAAWNRMNAASGLDDTLRLMFTRIAAQDSSIACQFDRTMTDLSDAEKDVVRRAWISIYQPDGQSKMPTIEEEMRSGRVTRACGDSFEG